MTRSTSRELLTSSAKKQLVSSDTGDFWSKSAIKLHSPNVPQGNMIIALLDNGSFGNVWCLLYEQGGDWTSFIDGDEYNGECIIDWMPEAIEAALKEVAEMPFLDNDAVLDDLEYFENWAKSAKETLK